MTNDSLSCDAGLACDDCGVPGAFAFDGVALCADCYQTRGSSCGGGPAENETEQAQKANATVPTQPQSDRHRLNPNCCYQACAQCSSIRRLREFRERFPQDWTERLLGSERLVAVAREGN